MSLFSTRPAGSPGTGRRNGQVAIFASLTLTLMFGALGLAMDLGWDYFLKERVQTAADAAAIAAVVYAVNNSDSCSTVTCGTALNCSGIAAPPASSLKAGCLYATVDGPPVVTASMIENNSAHPPAGLSGVAPSMWVKATVSAINPNSFLFLWGFRTATISAAAIGGFTNTPAGNCIYVLDPSASGAMTMVGAATVSTSCGIYINSTDPAALTKKGSGNITGNVDIVGNYSLVGSGTITPAPATGQKAVANPLASIQAPSFSGCDYTNWSTSGNAALTHGVYCGGISITGSGTITMGPGVYIMNGGGFSAGGSASITGSNIMIYNTAVGTQTIGAISMTGSGAYTLSAPNTGPYQGVLIFQDPTQSIAADVHGSGTSVVTGTLYFPDANLTYTGSTTEEFTALVADTVTLKGTTTLETDTTGTYTGLFVPKATLVQ